MSIIICSNSFLSGQSVLIFVEDQYGQLDPHWSPYHSLCSPCSIDYDWVIKLEEENLRDVEEFEDIIEPHELENPELMLPGQVRPDIPVSSWMMKKMKLKVTLRSKGRKSFR